MQMIKPFTAVNGVTVIREILLKRTKLKTPAVTSIETNTENNKNSLRL